MKNPKFVIFTVVFIDLLGFGIMIPMLPFYGRHFHATAFEASLLMFSYSVMQLFLAPLWGGLSDRYGRVPILMTTIFGQGLAFLMAALAPSYTILLASRILAGAFAANISTANAYMADITSKEDRSKGMGLLGAAFGMGFVFGPVIGSILIHYGQEWPSYVAAALCFFNFFWAWRVLKEPKLEAGARLQNRRRFSWVVLNEILANKVFFFPIFLFFMATLAFTQLEMTFGYFMLDEFQLTERQAGLMMGFLGVMLALVQGVLLGRFLKVFREPQLILMGCFFILISLVSLVLVHNFSFVFVSLMVMALGYGLLNPCLSAQVSRSADPQSQGRVMGVYQSAASLGRIIGPISAGMLYDIQFFYPFLVAAGVISVGSSIYVFGMTRLQAGSANSS